MGWKKLIVIALKSYINETSLVCDVDESSTNKHAQKSPERVCTQKTLKSKTWDYEMKNQAKSKPISFKTVTNGLKYDEV